MNICRPMMPFLFAVVSARAATLTGIVRDSQGAAIPNAYVQVHCDPIVSPDAARKTPCTKQDIVIKADAHGKFGLEADIGFYDIFVAAPGFMPFSEKTQLKGKGVKHFKVILKISQKESIVPPAVTQIEAATLSGTVLDPQGLVTANAYILVHRDPIGSSGFENDSQLKEDIKGMTDSGGRFSLEMGPGVYDVFVTAAGFLPHCEKIRLNAKKAKEYNVKLELGPNFLHVVPLC